MNLRVAIITENFLPKLDGVTHTLTRLLEHLQAQGHQALLLGPDSGMEEYAGAELVGTAGLPLPFYPELKFNFFRPLFVRRLGEFNPDIIHLVDPVILGATGIAAARFFNKPLVSSYHTNLAAYCEHFGFGLLTRPMWLYNRFVHNQCSLTFCPSPSTAAMLCLQGFEHLRIWPRGVDTTLFWPLRRDEALRAHWLAAREEPQGKTILLYVGRVSWEKNLRLLIQAYRAMDSTRCHLVIVGDGPAYAEVQQELAGLPVVGLLSEGVCDLVEDGVTGLLLNAHRLNEEQQIEGYRERLQRLVDNQQMRLEMSRAALEDARRHTWPEAMECIVRGYQEVIEAHQPLIAA